jgi:hypothetical protein
MRVYVVVILEPGGQLLHDGDCTWPWVYAGIVALKGFDEGLADAVAFRASDWREAWNKAKRSGKMSGLGGGIGGTFISQPLDRRRRAERIEPSLDAIKHHVADHFAVAAAGLSVSIRRVPHLFDLHAALGAMFCCFFQFQGSNS